MLDDLRKKRDEEKTQKKKKQQMILPSKGPGQTSLGFAGAQILGFGNTAAPNRDMGYHTAPRLGGAPPGMNSMMNTGMAGASGMNATGMSYNQGYSGAGYTQERFS